jgi:hypothetical protein
MDNQQTSTTTSTPPTQSSEPAFAFGSTQPPRGGKTQPVRAFAALALVGCMGFAMLIWYKLRVVTNVPRTAYAEPKDQVLQPAVGMEAGDGKPKIEKRTKADAATTPKP